MISSAWGTAAGPILAIRQTFGCRNLFAFMSAIRRTFRISGFSIRISEFARRNAVDMRSVEAYRKRAQEALDRQLLCHPLRLGARIDDLRKAGWTIRTEKWRDKDTVYHLVSVPAPKQRPLLN
jgi:hypothetical protein